MSHLFDINGRTSYKEGLKSINILIDLEKSIITVDGKNVNSDIVSVAEALSQR